MLILFLCALLSIVTTVGIVLILLTEAVPFFNEVSILKFLSGKEWAPLFSIKSFGVLPLLSATAFIAGMALLVAFPIGLLTAIYLSEYAPGPVRATVKPTLEVLAGIPTVVYGFFAITFISPVIIRPLFQTESIFNAISAATAMGVMLIPMVVSLSDDAMRAVPSNLREGAHALGANRFQVSVRVVVPAALSGIVAAGLLALARAVGETMIVTIAAGGIPNLSYNPFDAMQTMTAFIMEVAMGDTPRGTVEYESIFAVGLMLFVSTLVINLLAQALLAKFREVYE
ncbi:MAG: phosphate ABC transporter permease subunit PstC [Dehalococcoidia bacterium]|nr:phosphate ABC transporter permease subunit PstC [Dehalococcoidia bacterium]